MEQETQKEEQQVKKDSLVMGVSFTRWLIRALVGGICTVSVWLNAVYIKTIRKQDKAIEKSGALLDSCYSHRFDENTHRYDEAKQEIKELKEENKIRIDSLIRMMQKR